MNEYEAFQQLLSEFAGMLKEHEERLATLEARLLAHSKAIASLGEHPAAAEETLRSLENEFAETALSHPKFQISDAMLRLIKAGKKLDEPDS